MVTLPLFSMLTDIGVTEINQLTKLLVLGEKHIFCLKVAMDNIELV